MKIDFGSIVVGLRYELNLPRPTSYANDLGLMVENCPLVLHFLRREQDAISQQSVNAKSNTRGSNRRTRWGDTNKARPVITAKRNCVVSTFGVRAGGHD